MNTPAPSFYDWFAPETLARLAALRLRLRRPGGGSVAGEHVSTQAGPSVEFTQHRQYTPGDDLRYVDWNIFARSDRYYLKQSRQEMQLVCYAVIDASESMNFASSPDRLTKFGYAQQLAAALAFIASGTADRFACALVSDRLNALLPACGGSQAIECLPQWLHAQSASGSTGGSTNLRLAIDQFVASTNQAGLVLLISDLLGDSIEIQPALHRLQQAGHDVRVVHVMDRAEREFPFSGQTRLIGLESAGQLDVNGLHLQDAYRREVTQFIARMQQTCWQCGFAFLTAVTDQPVDEVLASQFSSDAQS